MRIAMISEHASPLAALGDVDAGGQNTHVAALASAVAALGHDVRVYTRRNNNADPESIPFAPGVDVIHVPAGPAQPVAKDDLLPYMEPFGRWLAASWSGSAWLPDVVHTHFWMSGVAAMTARRYLEVPLVATFHALGTVKRRYQGTADTSPPERVPFEQRLGGAADQVIAQCSDEVRELSALGIPAETIEVIPSGVDIRRFSPRGPAVGRSARLRILSVGRLVERKGHADLISALRDVPGAELIIIGGPQTGAGSDDPATRQLAELARIAGVSDRVLLAGAVDAADMPAWYRSADIVACAPWYEPFGLTPLEAMACGRPVVGSAVGGLTFTVDDGKTGYLVPPEDPALLAGRFLHLLTDEQGRIEMGIRARQRVEDHFTWPVAAGRTAVVYEELFSRSATPVARAGASFRGDIGRFA
jgi:D-inositol-3-phosphate glycosyltransferase